MYNISPHDVPFKCQ